MAKIHCASDHLAPIFVEKIRRPAASRSPEMVADGCVLLLESTRAVLVHGIGNTTPVDTLRHTRDDSTHPGRGFRAYFTIKVKYPTSGSA